MENQGKVNYICVRSKRNNPVEIKETVFAIKDQGLDGDYYNRPGNRQVTLIQQEHLDILAIKMKMDNIDPSMTRRNIVVKDIDLLTLEGKMFKIGEAILQYSGYCEPCKKMNKTVGNGGFEIMAIEKLGGITTKVIKDGLISIGNTIEILES